MIDFPASPTVAQTFVAPNGVTYQWNGTLWLTLSTGGAGAVQAGGGNFVPALNTDVVITFPVILAGNEGGWLNAAGRYTPPAGRYFIQCTNGVQAPTGGNGTWTLIPRKNGVRIANTGAQASGSALFSVPITVGEYVDANGTDYFDFVANCNASGMAAQGGQFTAYPLTGVQGPPGPVGIMSGDFCAYTASVALATTATLMAPSTILTGNSGNWYNPINGRYTPPVGRYFIRANVATAALPAASGVIVQLRKNGVALPGNGGQVPGAAGWYGDPEHALIVDANGSDYFDFTAFSGAGGSAFIQLMATPTNGIAGPPGPPGVTPDIPQNSQSASYTLVLTDAGKHIYHPAAAAAATYTIPANASVAFNIGAAITFVNDSANAVTIAIATDTLVLFPAGTTGSRTLAQNGMATALKVAATRWVISGVGLT